MPFPAKLSRDTILQTAMTLIEEGPRTPGEPPDAPLSLRSLADALGVRASSLYRHYADRDTLDTAIADEGSRLLLQQLQADTRALSPEDAMRQAAHTYLRFAHSRPRLYALMHAPRPLALSPEGPGKDLWRALLNLVGQVTGRQDDTSGVVAFWCFLHGFVALEASGQFGASGPAGGFERGLDALITGLAGTGSNTGAGRDPVTPD